ncbi:hypothetical protein INT44_001130 [Umbelopsis vinacea]|uniref:mRNA guanylyltransferase n=1 Tax=Umbelopsis vinacea TaxID=44442 RepID=A0A8H7UNM7_9FUNG|nr:hypothetical protein INT44_001130 [Umbelopsis vinacea]
MASIQQTGLAPTVQSVPAATSTPQDILNDSIAKRVDPVYSKTLQGRVQELLKIHHDGFPGSQPVSFETKHLIDLQREDYFVCEKSDGVRYLMFATQTPKGPATFLLDRNRSWFFIPHLLFPLRGKDNEYHNETLMDGELVMDIDENKNKTLRFLIFDLMVVNTQSVTQRAFSTRLGMLQQEVIQPLHNSAKKGAPFKVELKKMERSYGLALVFDQMTRLKHASDGVIFTPVKLPYTTGTCEKLLKWKPAEMNTVDFRIAVKWSKEHKPIYSLEVVAQGKNYKPYDHLQLETETALEWKKSVPDGKIGEFRYDPEWNVTIVEPGYAPTKRKGGWRFVKFRDDKELANDEQVVKKILKSIQDGVTKEQLLAHMEDIRTAWKAREKGIPMPEPVTKVPNASMKISTENLSKTLSGGPMAATPAIMSPSTNPFDNYTEKRPFHHGHRDSTSSIDYMPASRKNSLADSVKEQDLSPQEVNSRKPSLDDPMEDSDATEEKAHTMKNIQSPQWKEQTMHDIRKRSEDALTRFNIARKQSDEISVKSTNTEPTSADSVVVKQEPKPPQSAHASDSPHNAMDTSSGLAKDNETPGSAPVRVDMTLRQMIESKMPPKFRGSQGKKRSDSMKAAIDSPVLHSNPVLARADIGFDHRDVKRSKSDSPSSSNHSPQEVRKLSLPQTTEEQQSSAAPQPVKSQPMVKSPQSYNGKHVPDAEVGEYRRRKMSLSGHIGTIQMDRTQSPSQEAKSSGGKAQKLRKIDEQPTTGNAYLPPHHPPENPRAGRYDAMHDSPPMQMSSATVRHQQMWEQRASPYTIPTSKSTFAVPVSPYQAYTTRNTGFNPSEMYDTPRRNSDEKAMVPQDQQRHSMVSRTSSISAPPSRRPSQEEYSGYGKRPQPSSIADLLNNNVEVTSPRQSPRQGTHSPSLPRHERHPSGNERPTERPNPFDFAKILHSPAQHASDEEAPPHQPNGRGTERMSDDTGYSHQYSSQTGNAIHFINYRADGNQVQALTSSMDVPSRQEPASMGPKMYGAAHHSSHMSPHSPSTHSGMSSPESRHYQQQYAPAYASPNMKPLSTMYHSPGGGGGGGGGGVTRGVDPRHMDTRQPQQQQRDHSMPTPFRQTSYPSYAYRSPVLQHSTMSSPGRTRVEYPTAAIPQQQDRNMNVPVAPDDVHRQYRRSFGGPAKPYQEQSPPYSQAQTSPGARPNVMDGGGDDSGESSRKNNTKSKLDFILN